MKIALTVIVNVCASAEWYTLLQKVRLVDMWKEVINTGMLQDLNKE